ncbi:MAG TPA: HupE/UreJ family protein [Alcanivorax sp.]|nr:HupE/UreJ family protein [Alcanivorax sp.]
MIRFVTLLLVLIPALALGHKPSDSYLTLKVEDGGALSGQWDIALRDLERAVGVDSNRDATITWGELKARRTELRDHVLSHLTVIARNENRERVCTLDSIDLKVDDHVDGTYAVFLLHGDCGLSPLSLTLNYRFLFDRDASHQGLVKVRFGDRPGQAVALSNQHREQTLRRDGSGGLAALATFFRQGVHHILIGYDHILFLLTLLFPAVLVWRQGAWQPKESMREAVTTTLGIVTAFTVTHSLTLALASLGLVDLPSWLVESAIAITVGLGAASNLAPQFFPRRWVMALLFGLIHGLGFAAVLADLGLDGGSLVLTLLGFNLGVEAGQALIVLIFVPAAFLVRRTSAYRRWFVPIGSVAIIAIASVWAVERLAGAL